MYSNFSKPIRSWVLIIWLNNLNVTCYSSERDYLKFSPSMFTLYPLHPLSALGGWVLGLAMRSLYKTGKRKGTYSSISLFEGLHQDDSTLSLSNKELFNYCIYSCQLLHVFLLNSINCSLPLCMSSFLRLIYPKLIFILTS